MNTQPEKREGADERCVTSSPPTNPPRVGDGDAREAALVRAGERMAVFLREHLANQALIVGDARTSSGSRALEAWNDARAMPPSGVQDTPAREDSNPGDVRARRRAYQAGRSARMAGYAREVNWTDQDLAESWRGGWDQADAAIKADPAQAERPAPAPATEGETR